MMAPIGYRGSTMSKPGQRVLIALRKMIASGELAAGERIAEIPTAELLQVSRTPVRIAFRTLEQEGRLFAKGYVLEEDLESYHDLNMRFHQLIIAASGNPAIAEALARNDHLPFASVSSLAVDLHDMVREYRRFNFAHMQHHAVFDALVNGQGARAEAIMREHANATLRYAEIFGPSKVASEGLKVIQKGAAEERL